MHEYSKKIREHIKKVYGNPDKMSMNDLKELGEWADILKDLTEYDINYRAIEAMDEYEDMEYGGRMGYDNYRYKNGRFAPKGRGLRMGYGPYYHMQPEMDYDKMREQYPEIYGDYRMGYNDSHMMDGRSHNSMMGNRSSSKYGESYDRYRENKRHYTENKTPEYQQHMKESMNDYVDDVMDSFKDMWKDADATDRQTIKQAMTKLVQQMQ